MTVGTETAAFVPHLSGMRNLKLWWRAGGASLADADFEHALAVAGLGAAIDRKVKTYSQGMRQRLGLARAMLGAPPVLILDEPTNGLDPDGIADMRRFLGDLPARTGATVLLSSHLLGEIEQTATHVGIVHHGRLVLEGELARLKADLAPEIAVETDDPARAAALAAARGFVVTQTPDRIVASLKPGEDARSASVALNRALVEADVAVFAIGPRARTLEGIYREVSAPPAVQPLMQPELV